MLNNSAPSAFSPLRRWGSLAVLTASLLVVTMDMTILNIALPEMAAELHPSSDQQLWIIDIYSLVLAGLLVSFSTIADRFGRKRILLAGYATFGVASLLVLFVSHAETVIALRGLLGVGGAMIMPVTLSLIRVIFREAKERAAALSIWAAVSSLGAALGPLIGGAVIEHFSWHAAFLINVPLMLAGIIAGILVLPESRLTHPGRWDALAAALSFTGMTLIVWAVKTFGAETSFLVPEALLASGVGGMLMVWFVWRSNQSKAPLIDVRLFRSRVFSAGIIAALGSMFAMAAAMLLIAQWMQLVDGASPVEAGIRLLPVAVAASLSSLAAPVLTRWVNARIVLAGGITVAGFGMLLLGVAPGPLNSLTVTISLMLVGAGTGSLALGSALIMMGSPEEKAGNAGALEETSYEVGSVLGVAILGSIAAMIYRSEYVTGLAFSKLTPTLAEKAQESLGAAVAIAKDQGIVLLADEAGTAFTRGLQITGVAGGLIMFAVAVLVFLVTPANTTISEAKH